MKKIFHLIFIVISFMPAKSQEDTALYIFMGHPRDDDKTYEHVLKTVEKIDYSKFDLILLGGDLTWNTSAEISTLEYCDNIFNLGDENTHLAIGNHDNDNVASLLDYTKKPRYYAFTKNNITFLVLDTEINTPDFSGDQLELIQNVADTIETSDYLILLQHRIFWMIGNDDLTYLLDSVGASTRNLGTTNFYEEVYPNLRKAKDKGVEVLCLAGDRTDLNIEYFPEDSIQFLASGMKGTYTDDNNYTILLTHDLISGKLDWNFLALSEIDTIDPTIIIPQINTLFQDLDIYPNPSSDIFRIYKKTSERYNIHVKVLDINGTEIMETTFRNGHNSIDIDLTGFSSGVYFIRLSDNREIATGKIIKIK